MRSVSFGYLFTNSRTSKAIMSTLRRFGLQIALFTSYRCRTLTMLNVRFSIALLSWLLVGAILVTPVIAPIAASDVSSSPRVTAASSQSIVLIGFFAAWNNTSTPNPTITVVQGQGITIQLSSGDGVTHRFFVDVDKNGPIPDCSGADVCSGVFPPSTVLTFTVSFSPGTYTYYCSVHPTTMLGSFIVLAPPSTAVGGSGHLRIM